MSTFWYHLHLLQQVLCMPFMHYKPIPWSCNFNFRNNKNLTGTNLVNTMVFEHFFLLNSYGQIILFTDWVSLSFCYCPSFVFLMIAELFAYQTHRPIFISWHALHPCENTIRMINHVNGSVFEANSASS